MTGQEPTPTGRSGIAGKALDMVEGAGDTAAQTIGADHIVVKKTKKLWHYFLLYPAVFGAVLGAIPTGIQIYQSVNYEVGYWDVAKVQEQERLWRKNIRCVQSLDYHRIETVDNSTVQIGACRNGDVLIELIPKGAVTPKSQWVSIDHVKSASTIGSLLISSAFAAEADGSFKLAAAGKIKTVCSSVNMKTKTIEKILNIGGKCERQVVKMIGGAMIKRDPVPCNTKCTPGK